VAPRVIRGEAECAARLRQIHVYLRGQWPAIFDGRHAPRWDAPMGLEEEIPATADLVPREGPQYLTLLHPFLSAFFEQDRGHHRGMRYRCNLVPSVVVQDLWH